MLSFTGNILERASDRRSDPVWLAEQRQKGLVLTFWQFKPLLSGDPPRVQFLPSREIPESLLFVLASISALSSYTEDAFRSKYQGTLITVTR